MTSALEQRQMDILHRIALLEQRCGYNILPPDQANMSTVTSPIQQRLQQELIIRGINNHSFVRAPPEYYDSPLEFRQTILNAASIHHLCKSIVMENTRVEIDEDGAEKYYLVIVQYSAKLNSEKLKNIVHASSNGSLPKNKINMRLCPEEISNELTGFGHNAVSPIGIKHKLPIIMSDAIARLQPDFFWLGAGEVDLKVGMSADDFIRAYEPCVVDCTYR